MVGGVGGWRGCMSTRRPEEKRVRAVAEVEEASMSRMDDRVAGSPLVRFAPVNVWIGRGGRGIVEGDGVIEIGRETRNCK